MTRDTLEKQGAAAPSSSIGPGSAAVHIKHEEVNAQPNAVSYTGMSVVMYAHVLVLCVRVRLCACLYVPLKQIAHGTCNYM